MGHLSMAIAALMAVQAAIGHAENRELIPIRAPENVTLAAVRGKHVEVQWEPVPAETVRGSFRGYLVRIWSHVGSQVYAFAPDVTRATVEFFPYSRNFITVATKNERYVSPPSDAISFDAPQIEPNFPYVFHVFPMSNRSVFLRWSRPTQPNGVLTGYRIYSEEYKDYNVVNSVSHDINDPDKYQAKLTGLREGIEYEISISAVNCAGESERNTIKFTLNEHPPAEPHRPDFAYKIDYKTLDKAEACSRRPSESSGDDSDEEGGGELKEYDYFDYIMHHNDSSRPARPEKTTTMPLMEDNRKCLVDCMILWLPDVHNNPGDYFYVKYRIKGEDEFQVTDPEQSEDFVILKEFNACKNYEIVVTSVDGEYSTDSQLKVTPAVMFG